MSAVSAPVQYRAGEYHPFQSKGHEFLYLVSSGAVFEMSPLSALVLREAERGPRTRSELTELLASASVPAMTAEEAMDDLLDSQLLVGPDGIKAEPQQLPDHFPLQSMVLNLTNQCNLSCNYCYEYGEDKVATPEGKPKFMDWETAKTSVDYFFRDSAPRRSIHITFFGGETLMNFPLLKRVVEYATLKASEEGREVDFSLTTNSSLEFVI